MTVQKNFNSSTYLIKMDFHGDSCRQARHEKSLFIGKLVRDMAMFLISAPCVKIIEFYQQLLLINSCAF